jgi:phage tail-like protein
MSVDNYTNYDLKYDIPQFYRRDEDTEKFIELIQYAFDLIYNDIYLLSQIIDYEICDEKYLDLMIIEGGVDMDLNLTENLKRRLVKMINYIHRNAGNAAGIITVIEALTDITVQITEMTIEGFRIGEDYFGYDSITKLASGFFGKEDNYLHFIVNTPTLTAAEEDIITKIINYMKWANNTYEIRQIL